MSVFSVFFSLLLNMTKEKKWLTCFEKTEWNNLSVWRHIILDPDSISITYEAPSISPVCLHQFSAMWLCSMNNMDLTTHSHRVTPLADKVYNDRFFKSCIITFLIIIFRVANLQELLKPEISLRNFRLILSEIH